MEFNHKVQMSIDDWREFADDEDVSLAYGKVTFLSTKPNSHHHVYSEKVLKEYAPTYLGKFIVTDYDKYTGDSQGHTNTQNIVGYIPTNQEIYYDRDEEGYLQATVDVTLSKIYAPEVYKLFKENNYRAVSVEQLVGFTPETENYDDGTYDKEVVGFEGIGITILGLRYAPSVPTASIKLTKMSADNIDNIEKEYAQYTSKDKTETNEMSQILSKLESIEKDLKEIKNKKVAKFAIEIGDRLYSKIWDALRQKYPDERDCYCSIYRLIGVYEEENGNKYIIVEDTRTESNGLYKIELEYTENEFRLLDTLVKVELDFKETNLMTEFDKNEVIKFEQKFREEKMAENKDKNLKNKDEMAENETKDTSKEEGKMTQEKEMAEKGENKPENKKDGKEEDMKDDKMACGDKTKMSQEIEGLKVELSEKEKVIASQLSELKELRAFKNETQNAQKDSIVSVTLSKVKNHVDTDTFEKFKTSAESCKFEDINGWKNEVLASITEKVLMSEKHEDGIMDMGLPSNTERKTSIYD